MEKGENDNERERGKGYVAERRWDETGGEKKREGKKRRHEQKRGDKKREGRKNEESRSEETRVEHITKRRIWNEEGRDNRRNSHN